MNIFSIKTVLGLLCVSAIIVPSLGGNERNNSSRRSVRLSEKDAQNLVHAWERVEDSIRERAPRPDGAHLGDPAAPLSSGFLADLDEIRRCVCLIKKTVNHIDDTVGDCTDLMIPTVTGAPCITVDEINEICATVISWLKTIVSELRGNTEVCPI